jgi:LPS-assembly protein
MRELDSFSSTGGVPYVFGYEQTKAHATFEAAWQDQYILPGGLVATPYLGARLDAGSFTRTGGPLGAPYPTPAGSVSLLEATPIAAMDIRWPLVAVNGDDSHLFEPVAQLVYRGSSTTLTGITNDNAQSFVFDDTLLFSYDRFSGTDRQETGLRANVGGRYVANFADGGWLSVVAGQSFHLAGPNAMAVADHAQTGNSTGLGTPASYVVAGVNGSLGGPLTFGGKLQYDPNAYRLMRAAAAAKVTLFDAYDLSADYTYIPANAAVGILADQHEATLGVNGPLPVDYWYANAGVSWDIATNQWLEATGGITYDDGYFVAGVFGKVTGPTHTTPNSQSFGIRFRLRGPDGEWGL